MGNKWFRRRKPKEGTGYGVAGWKGLVSTVIFVAATIVVVIAVIEWPRRADDSLLHTIAAGIAAMVVLVGVFVVFVIGKSGDS